jgi:GntR family transcriptional regulator
MSKRSTKKIPRHAQISRWVEQSIEQGRFAPNDKLPSEKELSEQFSVSRITVRRALQTLENEKLIRRSQGLGSFVRDPRAGASAMQLTDFTEDMENAGRQASTKILSWELVAAKGRITEALGIPEGQKVVELVRLRLADDEPIALDKTYLPIFYGQLLEGQDLECNTIYALLEKEYEITVEKGCLKIEAETADAFLAQHLKIAEGAAILRVDRVSYTIQDKVVYYQVRFNRSDKIVYDLLAERQSGPGCSTLPLKEFAPVYRTDAEE